jgi:isoamylase
MTAVIAPDTAHRLELSGRELEVSPGRPLLLGATVLADGVNFAVPSTTARRVWLVLLDKGTGEPVAEIPFPDDCRVGNVFTMLVRGLDPDTVDYGYRVQDHSIQAPSPVLLDPYAKLLAGRDGWGVRGGRYRSRLVAEAFDWEGDRRPRIPPEELVIYELNLRGYTRDPSSTVDSPGTYAGLREKVPYLAELGVNCVELMPVAEFNESDNPYLSPDTGRPLLNSWGYNPIGFSAPKTSYAADRAGSGPVRELKELVKALHRAGIEVILDVVFNHTGEGDHRGPTLSFRGLDNATYYLLTRDGYYYNFSGTGNTLNCNQPVTRTFIRDCLRYWAVEYHIDGFRFDLASVLSRGQDGAPMANPPLLEALAHDPVLAGCKLIAEAWDAGGLYQVGSFPAYGRWMEWNGRYRDTVRRFLVGRENTVGDLATRIVGSPDLYNGRGTIASVNYVTCHDGFTLMDWASYDQRHNEPNGEGNRDGSDVNDSWNCGWEGPTDNPDVLGLRRRQLRNAILLLLTSHGVPMLLGGDEMGRTQRGNNNAYPHDSEISWVNWDLAAENADLVEFTRRCIAFRKAHPVLRRPWHPHGMPVVGAPYPPVSWHGTEPWQPDWSVGSRLLGVLLHESSVGDPTTVDGADLSDSIYLAVNSGPSTLDVRPPEAPPGMAWHVFANTAIESPHDAHDVGAEPALTTDRLLLAEHSAVALVARPAPAGTSKG